MKNIQPVFLVIFIISLVLHLLVIFSLYYPGTIITILFTAGMFFSWVFVSRILKDLSFENKDFQITQYLQKLTPVNKYTLLFFAFYAFFNFVVTMSIDSGSGWVDFKLGHDKLRGISGFWMFFYFLAFSIGNLTSKSQTN